MLQGLLMVAMFAGSYGVLYLIYGKEGMALRERRGKRSLGLCAVIALLLIFWVMSLLFWVGGLAKGDTALCIAVTFLVPVFLVIWGYRARKKVKQELEKEAAGSDQ